MNQGHWSKRLNNWQLEKSTSIWFLLQGKRGATAFVERKTLLILAIVMIFGGAGLLIAWLKGYFNDFSTNTNNMGKNNPFRSVTWK